MLTPKTENDSNKRQINDAEEKKNMA